MTFTNWPKKEYKNYDYEPLLGVAVLLCIKFNGSVLKFVYFSRLMQDLITQFGGKEYAT